MEVNRLVQLGRFWRKHWVVISFPILTVSSIFADLSHTKKWKKETAELAKAASYIEAHTSVKEQI